MKALALATLLLLLPGCVVQENQAALSPVDQTLVVCTSWTYVFDKISARRTLGAATAAQIVAVDAARPVLNPVCLSPVPSADPVKIVEMERLVLDVIRAE